MNIEQNQSDNDVMQTFFADTANNSEYNTQQLTQMNQALQTAVAQKNQESALSWKYSATFLALFVFLYAALGASLTLPLTSPDAHYSHKSIEYALEAIPVLIAFSGYFIAILYLFHCKTTARRAAAWEKTILTLEKQTSGKLFHTVRMLSDSASNYSGKAIGTTLALFIGFTWLVAYNYLTFTTSGTMGSVISLFISTMIYVILDIQLLKPSEAYAEPTGVVKDDTEKEDAIGDEKEPAKDTKSEI